jgi:hypothetical protein
VFRRGSCSAVARVPLCSTQKGAGSIPNEVKLDLRVFVADHLSLPIREGGRPVSFLDSCSRLGKYNSVIYYHLTLSCDAQLRE